jgi:uncharacterized protein YfaT (DUF1175 family)
MSCDITKLVPGDVVCFALNKNHLMIFLSKQISNVSYTYIEYQGQHERTYDVYVFDLKVNKEKCFWISENIAYSFEAI